MLSHITPPFSLKQKLVLLMMCASLSVWAEVTLKSNEAMHMQGLYFWYPNPASPTFLFNRNISPKGDCFDIVNGYAFLAWYKGGMENRNLMVSRNKIGTNHWITLEFPYANTLYTGIYKGINYANSPGGDSHRTASIGISAKDSTVHLVFDQHVQELYYLCSKKGIAFGPDSMFVLENFLPKRNDLNPSQIINSCTYPTFNTNDAGELILSFRIGTARQGDMHAAYYDGKQWSRTYNIVKGNNVDPQFNFYGSLFYAHGHMYMSGAIRVYGSVTEYNQGIYFGMADQRGNETWQNLNGQSFGIPLSNQLAPFKVLEPLPSPTSKMTSSPRTVITKNGAIHFTAQVSGKGVTHYYRAAGETEFKAQGNAPNVSFSASDNRVYAVETTSSNYLRIESTPEGKHMWRTDLNYKLPVAFANMVFKYYKGHVYIVGSELEASDKHNFRFLTLDLGIKNPRIQWASPTSDTTITEGAEFTVSVLNNPADSNITKLGLYINDTLLRTITAPPYTWGSSSGFPNELRGLTEGTYKIKTIASLEDGTSEVLDFNLTVLPDMSDFIKLVACDVSASNDDGHGPERAIDGELHSDSRWASKGKGQSIALDFCKPYSIEKLSIAWFGGNRRSSKFEIEVSSDSIHWANIFTGQSSGTTEDFEPIEITPTIGRYLRYVGNGNSFDSWNAILECEAYGKLPTPTIHTSMPTHPLAVYPNPAHQRIYLSHHGPWELYTINGNLLAKGEGRQVNISHLQSGIYLIKAQENTYKILKK